MPDGLAQLVETNASVGEIFLRLFLAVLCGMAIGFDRELRDRPAGLRTHMLVALAAAAFTVIALELFYEIQEVSDSVTGDPIRIIEAVTAGVAFLAAGTIIQSRGNVVGLTTGASMWLAGATGLACGGGFYVVAILTLVLALPILALLYRLEVAMKGDRADAAPAPRKETQAPKQR